MSYSISISGHKDVEDGKEFEEEIVTKAKEFVSQLEGVTSAMLSGAHVGSVSLMEGT